MWVVEILFVTVMKQHIVRWGGVDCRRAWFQSILIIDFAPSPRTSDIMMLKNSMLIFGECLRYSERICCCMPVHHCVICNTYMLHGSTFVYFKRPTWHVGKLFVVTVALTPLSCLIRNVCFGVYRDDSDNLSKNLRWTLRAKVAADDRMAVTFQMSPIYCPWVRETIPTELMMIDYLYTVKHYVSS